MSFDTARAAWKAAGRPSPPRLVMCCWFALGSNPGRQIGEYLQRYLNFLGSGVAEQVAPTVKTTSAASLKEVIRILNDLGADELLLVPTTIDSDEVDRVAQIVG